MRDGVVTQTSNDRWCLAVVAAVACLSRAWVAYGTPDGPLFLDMAEYWERAVYHWQHGALFPDSWRMPGLPAALAAAFTVAGGPSVEAARWVNVLAGTVTAMLTYLLARRTATPAPAMLAGLTVALYPALLSYVPLTVTETLVMAPMTASLLAATYRSPRGYLVAGCCAGLAALVRPPAVVLVPALMTAALLPIGAVMSLPRRAVLAGAAVAAFVLMLSPWWIHTAQRHGYVVPFDTTGGTNLLIGNGPGATGRLQSRLFVPISQDPSTGPLYSPERDRRQRQMALDYAFAHPWDTVRLLPAKFTGLFALEGREQAYMYSVGIYGALSGASLRIWGWAMALSIPPLLLAAVLGVSVRHGVASPVAAPLLAFLLMAIAFHLVTLGDPRYHLPFVPALAVLATGLHRLGHGVSLRRLTVVVPLLMLLLPVWWTQWQTYDGALDQLAQPDGHARPLDYDALL